MTTLARPKAFAVQWSQMERWAVSSFHEMDWRWPKADLHPLSDALDRRSLPVDRSEHEHPPLVTLHFTGEMHHRDRSGTKAVKGKLWWAQPGDVLYSKIDVRNGAIGVVPEELGAVAVTSEYPVYTVHPSVADAEYIKLVFRTSVFRRKINSLISGASGRKRVQPSDLEALVVPLPPIPTQRAIVAAFDRSRGEVARLRAEADKLEADAEAEFLKALGLSLPVETVPPKCFAVRWSEIERWSVLFNQLALRSVELGEGHYPVAMLGDVARVSYGLQKAPGNRPGLHARPYLRVANVQRGNLDLAEIKYIDVPDDAMPSFRLEPGDLLFVEGNGSPQELGRCALWSGEIEDCVHQNHILKVRAERNRLLPEYAMAWFNTPCGKDHFFKNVKTSSGLGTINSTELKAAPLPLPDLNVQEELVNALREAQRSVADLRARAITAEQTARDEVEAMILGTHPVPK